MENHIIFPANFLWGSGTSSYQVEGGIGPVRSLARAKGASPTEILRGGLRTPQETSSIKDLGEATSNGIENDWSEAAREGKIPAAGRACDSYNRYEEDFNIAKSLGQNAHRFSIEWARIEPEEGKFDESAIEHYRKVLTALRERGLEPFVTLWHFTLPIWFAKMGGFENSKAPFYFARYCEYVVSGLAASASSYAGASADKEATASQGGIWPKFWITINEPMVYASQGYSRGVWLPFKKGNFIKLLKVVDNLITSHNVVYKKIKSAYPTAQVGIAKNNKDFLPNKNPFNQSLSMLLRWFWNRRFLAKISDRQDFIGLNYYFATRLGTRSLPDKTDMGWEIYPEGLYDVLKELKRYHRPIYITENGLADAKDAKRAKFIKDHLYWVGRAIHDGVDVRGYFYWSLLDNFEWARGFSSRFGLVEMNYDTMERKIRPSAYEYKKICESNSLIPNG